MRLKIRCWWFWIIIFVPALAIAGGADWYQAGVTAFQEGNYKEALNFFRQAENEGIETPNLYYNLGAAYYKARQYDDASKQFQKLAELSDWQSLALYNLGLIAEARGDPESALSYYHATFHASADTSRLKQRAALKLIELETHIAEIHVGRRWYGMFTMSVGHDDNAVLAPDTDLGQISRKSDLFTDLYAFAGTYLRGDYSDGLRVEGGFYARLHAREHEYHFGTLFTGMNRDKQFHAWRSRMGIGLNADVIEDHFYAITPTLQLAAERSFNAFVLRLANSLSWIEAQKDYDYLTGARNRASVDIGRDVHAGAVWAGYAFEYNNRRDLNIEDLFYSYSPFRHSVYLKIEYPVADRWRINAHGEFRRSIYPDANRYVELMGSVFEDKRQDNLVVASVQVEYRMTQSLALIAEYRHADNGANIQSYTYTSNQILFGCRWTF